MLLVGIDKCQYTDVMAYNTIIKRLEKKLQCKSELEDKVQFFSFIEINDHHIIKGTNSIYEVIVSWDDVSITL